MKVHWSARAQTRLDAIHAYIAWDNPGAAPRIVQQIARRAGQLATFPARDDVRELIEGEYRIVYRVGADRIDWCRSSTAQRLPPELRKL